MKRSKSSRSRRRSAHTLRSGRQASIGGGKRIVLPSTFQIRKLCHGEGLVVKDAHCIKKLQDVYRTFLIKIVKVAGQRKGAKRSISYEDIIFSLTSLFGTRIQSKLEDGTVVVDKGTFRKMFFQALDILASNEKSASTEILDVIQKAVEVCVAKAFLAPLAAWQFEKKGMDAERYVTMSGLQAVNQVHLVSGSEYFSPSLVKYG